MKTTGSSDQVVVEGKLPIRREGLVFVREVGDLKVSLPDVQ